MIRVQAEVFDVGDELAAFTRGHADAGGLCVFVGLVREFVGNARLAALELEHYPAMTQRELARIETEAKRRWPLIDSLVIHRYGRLTPGEPIVLVATLAAHRNAAFDACHFLIDWLKTQAPFWKREETSDGGQWVAARDEDLLRAAAWSDAGKG